MHSGLIVLWDGRIGVKPKLPKVIGAYVLDIAHICDIYEILHCNQFIIPSKATAWDTRTSCLTTIDFAVQAEMVAVKTSTDVSNTLWIFYDCLTSITHTVCLGNADISENDTSICPSLVVL